MRIAEVKMPTKLEQYVKAHELKQQAFGRALHISTRNLVEIGPTSKGNIFIRYRGKEIGNTESPDDLRELRNTIDQFLRDVVGEP